MEECENGGFYLLQAQALAFACQPTLGDGLAWLGVGISLAISKIEIEPIEDAYFQDLFLTDFGKIDPRTHVTWFLCNLA